MLAIWNFAHILTAAVHIAWWGLKVPMEKFAKWWRHTLELYRPLRLGLQRYTSVPVHCDIFCHNTNIVYWTSYHDIYDTFTHVCINKHGKALSSISVQYPSAYAWRFLNKLTRKIHAEQRSALHSRWRTQQTYACFQLACQLYRLLSPQARHEAIPYLFCCYVTHRIMYRIGTTVLGYVSYCGKCIVAGLPETYAMSEGETIQFISSGKWNLL